jgi:hypothetical protein
MHDIAHLVAPDLNEAEPHRIAAGYRMARIPDTVAIPLKIALIYVIVAECWIFFSDSLVASLFSDPAIITRIEMVKGGTFVLVTAMMLFWLIRRYVASLLHRDEALQAQFSQLTTIFDEVNALIYVADLNTYELLYLNKFGTGLFGNDWRGKNCYKVLQAGQSGPCSFCTNDRMEITAEFQLPLAWEFQNTVTGRWYQCIDRAIRWPDGRLVRMEIAFDISDRKQMEQLKDEMVSAVSHEMRTPLTAMLGYIEYMLENDVPPDRQQEYLRTVFNESERLNELIGNFLDMQRLKIRPELFPTTLVPVAPLLREAFDFFGAHPLRHHLVIEPLPDLPRIRGNSGQLHQVLVNLIANAIKYSPEGSTITIDGEQAGEEIVLRVRDEGMGVPPDMREKIFERFFRIDNSDRRKAGGTGLGLALVREIVAAHGGRVWVESPGKGSIFCVQLPSELRKEGAGEVV